MCGSDDSVYVIACLKILFLHVFFSLLKKGVRFYLETMSYCTMDLVLDKAKCI